MRPSRPAEGEMDDAMRHVEQSLPRGSAAHMQSKSGLFAPIWRL
jgi:hypothetical protein